MTKRTNPYERPGLPVKTDRDKAAVAGKPVKQMAPSHSLFSQHGEPNEKGRCHWCGRKLRAAKATFLHGRGAYGDNSFCGVNCGYEFAVSMLVNGQTLVKGGVS